MNIERLRATLREFSKQTRAGLVVANASDGAAVADLADLADQLERALSDVVARGGSASETKSFLDLCPCCGRV